MMEKGGWNNYDNQLLLNDLEELVVDDPRTAMLAVGCGANTSAAIWWLSNDCWLSWLTIQYLAPVYCIRSEFSYWLLTDFDSARRPAGDDVGSRQLISQLLLSWLPVSWCTGFYYHRVYCLASIGLKKKWIHYWLQTIDLVLTKVQQPLLLNDSLLTPMVAWLRPGVSLDSWNFCRAVVSLDPTKTAISLATWRCPTSNGWRSLGLQPAAVAAMVWRRNAPCNRGNSW